MFGSHLLKPKANPTPAPQTKNYRIQPGEYFPWKGFMFKVTDVTDSGFTAETVGVTKKLAHLVKKEDR